MNSIEEFYEFRMQCEAALRKVQQIGYEKWRFRFERAQRQEAVNFDRETAEMEGELTFQDLSYRRQQILLKSQANYQYLEFIRQRTISDFYAAKFQRLLKN